MRKVKVRVVNVAGRGLVLRWNCPKERRTKQQAAGTDNPKEAKQAALLLQAQLNSGTYVEPSRVGWEQFRDAYETQVLPGRSEKTANCASTALDWLERLLRPSRLMEVDAEGLSLFQERLRQRKKREATIGSYLRHIKAALSWAKSQGLLAEVPRIVMPKRQGGMKGRPLDEAEFRRLLEAVEKVRPKDAEAWRRLLTGLWLSGLRLREAVDLSWDRDAVVSVDQSGPFPVLRFLPQGHKAFRDERTPITPDFAAFLLAVPAEQRLGRLFPLVDDAGNQVQAEWAGKVITRIGKAAKIIVNGPSGKYASAHDLRRSFGTRWASRLPAPRLQRLMRHQSIQTTLEFYVAHDADAITAELFAQYGQAKRAD